MLKQQQTKDQGKIKEILVQGTVDMKIEAEKALLAMEVTSDAALSQLKSDLIKEILMATEGQQSQQSAQPAA
jgi:hypothetical protein